MERCPNCGAPARPGAKFCTTCGYRLPAAVAPAADQVETPTSSAASWPAPPAPDMDVEPSDQSSATESEPAPASTVDVVIPAAGSEMEPIDETRGTTIGVDDAAAASTDEVLSSSWPSTSPTDQPSPWTTGASGDAGGDEPANPGSDAAGVSEETVVVSEPASQYEGWSAAVVEEVAPISASTGTNIARATALLDELRLLLPVLGAASSGGSDTDESLAGALKAAVASANAAADDRRSLRDALNEARDNPRDIQTILALSLQADAAIALLDEHERLIAVVERAIGEPKAPMSGIYPSSS